MLADEARPGDAEDATRVTVVRDRVDRVARQFDQLAATAPNDDMRRHSIDVATSLRGYFFALEAQQMLHNAPTTPTADQLGTADATKRARAAELEAAATAIRVYVRARLVEAIAPEYASIVAANRDAARRPSGDRLRGHDKDRPE